MNDVDKENIDKMVEDLIKYLNKPGINGNDLMIRAINVATTQWDFRNSVVGVAVRITKMIKKQGQISKEYVTKVMRDNLLEQQIGHKLLMANVVTNTLVQEVDSYRIKQCEYADELSLGLDKLVGMYSKANG